MAATVLSRVLTARSCRHLRGLAPLLILLAQPLAAAELSSEAKRPRFPPPAESDGVPLIPAEWSATPIAPLTSDELDALLVEAQASEGLSPAPAATDEEFARRAYLDLTGALPPVGQPASFAALDEPNKRAELIDELLEGDEFCRQQSRYWRDLILARNTDTRSFIAWPRGVGLEDWLYKQFRERRSWADITRDLITARGEYKLSDPTADGSIGFLMCHTSDTQVARANDTARIFLGMNIACAQCHDAPEHVWKRDQFHELAAFYARLSYAVNVNAARNYNFITTLVVKDDGEYETPDAYDATRLAVTHPRFLLTGQTPPASSSDEARRAALADYVTDGRANYYFSAALVNRVWGRLMGQAFSKPVDDLGPLQTVEYPGVLRRLAAATCAADYDLRALYRLIMNSQAYQRGFRMPVSSDEHLHFTATCPTPMRQDALWSAIGQAVGPLNAAQLVARKSSVPLIPFVTLRELFDTTFGFDPALPTDEVEATVGQALFLMNNAAIQAGVDGRGDTLLAALLVENKSDQAMVNALYTRALGRKPSERESRVCLEHVQASGDRARGFEDVQWALINSTEFRTKH